MTTTTMQDSKFGEHLYLTPRVPQGLAAAVEGLTREVIRHRPDNIYAFAARHFENLLRMREQYDEPPSTSEDKKATEKLLREVNEAVRQRYDDDVAKDEDQARGWSLNETAKVLEKHRSIFGDSGQKVSTEQIRELANEPVLTSRQDGKKVTDPGTSRRRESPKREASRNAPKMLSQIPIAKDIKTELRRNRISSRERKKVVACEYTRETTIIKKSSSFEKTKKSYEMRKSSRTEDTKKRTETLTKSRTNSQDRKFTRGGSMDSVKNYVVQNFVGMTSLDELQSPSYVEKVQEVIDETSSVIKEKVEALKSGFVRAAKAKQKMRKDGSSSSSEERSRRNSKEDQETTSLPAVRPPSSKSTSRSVSAKSGDSDAALTLPPISPEAAKSAKVKEDLVLPALSPPRTNGSLEDDTTADVGEIAEDATLSLEKVEERVEETTKESVEDKVEESVEVLEEKVDEKKTERVVEEVVPSEENVVASEEKVDDKKAECVAKEIVPSEDAAVEDVAVSEKKVDEKMTDSVVEEIVPSEDKSVPPKDEQAVPVKEISDEKENVHEKLIESEKISDEKENVHEKLIESEKISDEKENVNEKLIESEKINDEKIVFTEKSEEIVIKKSEETVTEKSEEIVIEKSEETVTEKGEEIVIETSEEAVIDKSEEIVIEKSEETVIDKSEEIMIEKIEEVIIDEKQMSADLISTEKASSNFLQVKEEEFHDSLNVTPEPFDTKGQRPDSLETSIAEDNKSVASSGHVSPLETLKDKLLEIEEVQKRIEDVLDDTKTSDVVGKTDEAIAAKIEDKLIEIQESEKRIEQILDSQSATTETMNSDIKNKLQELEDVERRIENIFDKDAPTIDVKETVASEVEETSKAESEEKETATATTTNENLSVPTTSKETTGTIEETRAVSPHSYILTEGSPYEIPDSVTTVIIPDRTPSPDSETLQVEVEDSEILSTLLTSKESDSTQESAFGEPIAAESSEPSTVDAEYARGIKASHDAIVSRESLDRIKEEVVDSEDEKVLKVVTSSLEEILEKEEVEYVEIAKYTEEKVETIENSLESTARSVESTTTNEMKETSVTTDRSSLSLDQAVPIVPDLNLDSLPDLSISSFNVTSSSKKEDDSSLQLDVAETQEFEKLEAGLQLEPTAATVTAVINNAVCAEATSEENNDPPSQCTAESIDATTTDEKKAYHIYVPEAGSSKEPSSSSETSTFMSAATKIQAGVRGFLTRRRLQSTQKRSSTLDSVPSIQESFAVETSVTLMPIVESTTATSDSKARKKLRREDAVQRTTLSVENAFAENQIQHTGEFHDCIPLPVFDSEALSLKSVKQRQEEKAKEKASQVEHLLEKILLGHAAANFGAHPKLVDVMLLPADTELQSKYLNFITSVEDVFSDVPETPKGVIIEEITSLDEASKSLTTEEVKKEDGEETLASISTSEDPLSINIEEVLGLGEEDEPSRKSNRLNVKLNAVDQIRSSSVSQDSPVSDERTRSPVTMMQIAPKSVDEKSSEENPTLN